MEITDENIGYAEQILLPEGKTFDPERRDFIKNLDTVDLEAVPGSGKTTALLAKLILLEQQMPLKGSKGVLVLSHTNTAVDEIKNKIGKIAPRLFEYPNFVGTIQSFVDHFLAIPYYTKIYGKRHYRIDNEIYKEKVEKYLENTRNVGFKNWVGYNGGIEMLSSIRFDEDFDLIPAIGKKSSEFRIKNKQSPTYKAIKLMKERVWEKGVLHFDDAYILASKYLQAYPKVKTLLQKRFSYVFVDEMQDMDQHQHDILEGLFYDQGSAETSYQRIGDINQAIHSNISSKDTWTLRGNSLRLEGSHRLTPQIAEVVKYFGLEHIDIRGLSADTDIFPVIIPYATPEDALPKFVELIKEKGLEQLGASHQYPFRAIGWSSYKPEEDRTGKTRIQDYFSSFEREKNTPKVDYHCLQDYLTFYSKSPNVLAPIRKNILGGIVRILRLEGIKDEYGRDYSISKFWSTIKNYPDLYERFKKDLFTWVMLVHRGENSFDPIKQGIEKFFLETPDIFEIEALSPVSQNFLNGSAAEQEEFMEENTNDNVFSENGVNVKVSTIHAVKGETHTATLYMECFYYKDGGKSYESQRLADQFSQQVVKSNAGVRVQHSAKMAYVGFSRPTHLLCLAVHESRVPEVKNNIWEIYSPKEEC